MALLARPQLLDALARGVVDLTGARGPDAAADELQRAQACAAALCQASRTSCN